MVDSVNINSGKTAPLYVQPGARELDDIRKCRETAERLEHQGKHSRAVMVYQQFIDKYPGSVCVTEFLDQQVFCYGYHLKEYGKALEICHKIIDLHTADPIPGPTLYDMYYFCKKTQKYGELVWVIEKIVTQLYANCYSEAKEQKETFLFEMGFIYKRHLHNPEKAVSIFKQIIKEFPRSMWIAAFEAEFLLSKGDFENAMEKYKNILDQDFYSYTSSGVDLPEEITSDVLDLFKIENKTVQYSDNKDYPIAVQKQIMACVFLVLPQIFFENLSNIDLVSYISKACRMPAGYYNTGEKGVYVDRRQMESKYNAAKVVIHELMHHWDLKIDGRVLKRFNIKVPSKDPSSIYYSISWSFNVNTNSWLPRARKKDSRDFMDSWYGSLGQGFLPADNKYGMKNEEEDFATFGTAYIAQANTIRKDIRAEMARGNFEPAAKYLYVRFCTPFLGKEFAISENNTSLGFEEVKSKFELWLKDHPNSVAKSTIEAINNIEKVFLSYPADLIQ